MTKFGKEFKRAYKTSKKGVFTVYTILRVLVILCLILELIRGDYNNAFLCLLSLFLFTLPYFIQKTFKITLPNMLEILIFLFIFSAEILGEIQNFYGIFPYWDSMLHVINGFLAAGIGFALVDLLNKQSSSVNLSPLFVAIVSFCFSMTVGVCWEFFEFGADRIIGVDMQKDTIVEKFSTVTIDPKQHNNAIMIDNIDHTIIYSKDKDGNIIETRIDGGYLDIGIYDTMKDLLVNLIGATTFSVIGFFYILNRDKYKFARNFIPVKNRG